MLNVLSFLVKVDLVYQIKFPDMKESYLFHMLFMGRYYFNF